MKRQGPKNLKVTIDVDEAAQTELKFDIQVRSRRGGRSGKGTELFAVQQKSNGQDTTPPGEPTNLQVLEEKYGSAKVSWTMPADDGYDPSSGPVFSCDVSVTAPPGSVGEPYLGWCEGGAWADPGLEQVCVEMRMQPETTYPLGVSCRDEAGNWSTEAAVVVTTRPFSEFQDPSWTLEELAVPVDALVGHDFDGAGNVVVVGVVDLWSQRGGGRWALIPTMLRIVTGTWNTASGGWDWGAPVDLPGGSRADGFRAPSRFRIDSEDRPAFASWIHVDSRSRLADLAYTFHDGYDWQTENLVTESVFHQGLGFAFDPAENPAIAWCSRNSSNAVGGIRLARRDTSGQWSIEAVNEECYRGNNSNREVELAFDDLGNPVIGYSGTLWSVVRWSGQAWVEEPLSNDPSNETLGTPSPVFDAVAGDLTAAGWNYLWEIFSCDRSGGAWQCDNPFLGAILGGGDSIDLDSWGELFVAYSTEADKDVALARRLAGSTTWTQEYVDHPSTRSFSWDGNQDGPFVALDPSGFPTLSWTWNVGGRPPWRVPPLLRLEDGAVGFWERALVE